MNTARKRATVYLDRKLHRALQLKAARNDCSISRLVNDAVREALAEDAEDLAAFDERAHEPRIPLEDVLRGMKKRGKL